MAFRSLFCRRCGPQVASLRLRPFGMSVERQDFALFAMIPRIGTRRWEFPAGTRWPQTRRTRRSCSCPPFTVGAGMHLMSVTPVPVGAGPLGAQTVCNDPKCGCGSQRRFGKQGLVVAVVGTKQEVGGQLFRRITAKWPPRGGLKEDFAGEGAAIQNGGGGKSRNTVDTLRILFVAETCIFRHSVAYICNPRLTETLENKGFIWLRRLGSNQRPSD